MDWAIAYLAKQQDDDGSLSSQMGIGPTALTTLGLLRNGRGVADPQVAKGLKYLAGFLQADGGIHPERSRVPNYETCVALVCFQEANRDGRYDKVIRSAEKFIRTGQFDEGEDKGKSDLSYSGVKSHPGMGDAGLYYYYHSFAKTLDVLGIDEIEDAQGVKHDWRRDLTEELARRQQANGGWVNTNSRWMESDPNLATSFAILALSYCRPVAASGRAAR